MKYLVTGCAGFIEAIWLTNLLSGFEVIGLTTSQLGIKNFDKCNYKQKI